jgi:hypothetical integral membrane protein (TIGR02206 family)
MNLPLAAFQPFGTLHAGVVLASLGVIIFLCAQGARAAPHPERSPTHKIWTIFTLFVQVFNIAFYATPPRLELATSLPLHVCDLAGLFACLSLVTRARFWRMILFFWGLGLSTQAFITPVITDGPQSVRFWLFFVSHLTIVGTAAYDLASDRFRPKWKDVLIAIAFTTAYGILIVPFNLALDANYGYAGNTRPDQPTLIDKLGAWPQRLGLMWLIVSSWLLVIALPWVLRPRSARPAPSRRAD